MFSKHMHRFIKSKKKVIIYAIIKSCFAIALFYLAYIDLNASRQVILVAFGFIILMTMAPVLVLHSMENDKKKRAQASKKK